MAEVTSQEVLRTISRCPGIQLDDLIQTCGPYSWNQIVLAVDELARDGLIVLRRDRGSYTASPRNNTIQSDEDCRQARPGRVPGLRAPAIV